MRTEAPTRPEGRFVCPETGCGALLTAYYAFKAGHPIDEDRGYVYDHLDGNVLVGARWEIDCERGHRLGVLRSEDIADDEESCADISPETVTMWLRGRLWNQIAPAEQPQTVKVRMAAGRVLGATDARGRPVEVEIEKSGPSVWVTCEGCGYAYPTHDVNDMGTRGWLCYKCDAPERGATCIECGERIEPDETVWIERDLPEPMCDFHGNAAADARDMGH